MSIVEQLRKHGLSPKKSLGQNFLTDVNAARTIAEAAVSNPRSVALEIGPGLGALTSHLLEKAERVIAVEKDSSLAPLLRERFASDVEASKLRVIEGDALDVDWCKELANEAAAVSSASRVLVGNLPYLITGQLLERATQMSSEVSCAVFMIQREVANRLVAAPSTSDYGALTVFVQAAFHVERVLIVRSGAFYPKPNVDSAVVRLVPHQVRRAEETPAFQRAVKLAFQMRRKTLRNAWRGIYGLSKEAIEERATAAQINLDRRGETLSVEEFARFAEAKSL